MIRLIPLVLLLVCQSLVSKTVKAETDVIAQPNAIGNSSIINQNMNINNGMTGKQQFGTLVCSQTTMAFTPFYTGNEAENPDPENGSYSINQGWGFQISWMIPLGSTHHTCADLALVKLELAKVELDKNILDTNVVRILKCAELAKAGYMINPNSDYAWICQDVVNIRNWVRQNPDLFSD